MIVLIDCRIVINNYNFIMLVIEIIEPSETLNKGLEGTKYTLSLPNSHSNYYLLALLIFHSFLLTMYQVEVTRRSGTVAQ